MEIACGSFARAAALPENADTDKIQARFDGGVLEIRIPATIQTASSPRVAIVAQK
jgi:HSP20 family molecular chaperone IbpA